MLLFFTFKYIYLLALSPFLRYIYPSQEGKQHTDDAGKPREYLFLPGQLRKIISLLSLKEGRYELFSFVRVNKDLGGIDLFSVLVLLFGHE